jgi:hypothetical protein
MSKELSSIFLKVKLGTRQGEAAIIPKSNNEKQAFRFTRSLLFLTVYAWLSSIAFHSTSSKFHCSLRTRVQLDINTPSKLNSIKDVGEFVTSIKAFVKTGLTTLEII